MYGTIAYNNSACAAGAENALNAVTDPDITQQSSEYIFTGDYKLLAAALFGVSVQYGRYDVAEWNGRGRPNIFAANRGATPPADSIFDFYGPVAPDIPKNQILTVRATNNLGTGTEAETAILQIGTPDWSLNQPQGMYDIILRATAAITPTINAWNESNAITFDAAPLGGVYAVLGCLVVGGNAIAYRLNFPRTRLYGGRRLRPGGIVVSSWGNVPLNGVRDPFSQFGVLGAFHTFEPPTLGIFGEAASNTTYNVFLKCRFLGQQVSLLDQFVSSNY